ncbi:hypothetical protein [Desulforamulus ferrireducens]|uniref:Uncharacterized protein n=1 Tax=Desulforamulus ferrireducens TaxID=1833852 RepID=A0A1S6IWC8_9FIRM|nr:hypothetical protein [Desulforamulus ferrireducens]AQS59097.1 hypothetical protein B0537_08385 [Desulforamulus ferrireducens]
MKQTPWLKDINQLAYIIPIYLPEGDGTEIMNAAGNCYYDSRNIRSLKRIICHHFALDYQALRQHFCRRGGTGQTPLTLAPGYTLLAVKTRSARCAGDPCYGYVNLKMIASVEKYDQEGFRARLVLTNGGQLFSVSSVKTIQNSLLLAKSMAVKESLPEDVTLADLLLRFLKLYEQEKKGL